MGVSGGSFLAGSAHSVRLWSHGIVSGFHFPQQKLLGLNNSPTTSFCVVCADTFEAVNSHGDPSFSVCLHNLGELLEHQCEYHAAVKHFERSLLYHEKIHGLSSLSVSVDLKSLARIFQAQVPPLPLPLAAEKQLIGSMAEQTIANCIV